MIADPLSFLAAASAQPGRDAVVEGDRVWTYGELAPRVAASAAWLKECLGGGREEGDQHPRVALLGASRLPQLVACYALIEAGIPFVAIHPRWTLAERERAIGQARVRLSIDEQWSEPDPLRSVGVVDGRRPVDFRRPLAVLFTSGTSGRPRAAVLSRRAFAASAQASAANLGWQDDDRWLLSLPFAHVGGLSVVTRTLIARRALVLEPEGGSGVRRFVEAVERGRVTMASVVPTQLHRLLAERESWNPPSFVRAILVGGARAPEPLLARARTRGWPVLTTYGLTESCSQVATQGFGAAAGAADCGRPLDGVTVRIRGATAGGPSPAIGRIELRGEILFDGYLEADGSLPLRDPGQWFETGDHGYLDAEGRLHIVGRRSDLIISGGENVYPAEVEQVLETHPDVAAACVFGVADDEWGERVAAALVASGDRRPAPGEIERFLDDRLSRFKRPARWSWQPSLPLLRSGKVDRRACRGQTLVGVEGGPADFGVAVGVDRAALERLAAELAREWSLESELEPWAEWRWRPAAEPVPSLHLDDFSGIPFLDGIAGVAEYQHRARVRARDGDLYAATTPPVPGYEDYCRDVLELGSARCLEVAGAGGLGVADACRQPPAFGALVDFAAAAGGLVVHPFMGIESVWRLAAEIARAARVPVRVLGPPPPVTWIANDKARFDDLVLRVLGPQWRVESQRSSDPGTLARQLFELAGVHPRVALKRLRCASAMGNQVFQSAPLLAGGVELARRRVEEFLEATGWDRGDDRRDCGEDRRDRREEVLAVAWEDAAVSPSTQWWIPAAGEGVPRLDGIYEQILEGEERVFVGSRPSQLPEPVHRRLAAAGMRIATVLQQLGYVGRCSFDHLVLGDPQGDCALRFTECNGRWGGTSTPMHLVDRAAIEVGARPRRPVYRAQDIVSPQLVGLPFDEVLRRVGEAVYRPGSGRGRFAFYNPGPLAGFGKFDAIALGGDSAAADRALEVELPALLGIAG